MRYKVDVTVAAAASTEEEDGSHGVDCIVANGDDAIMAVIAECLLGVLSPHQ